MKKEASNMLMESSEILGVMKDQGAVELLIQTLRDPSDEVRLRSDYTFSEWQRPLCERNVYMGEEIHSPLQLTRWWCV